MAKKIMIVDDDPVIVDYLKKLFSDNGYDTCVASDGSRGIDILKQEKPDLITLDLEMPEEWGPSFFRRLSQEEQFKNTPVIVISGLSGNQYAIHKAVASITKPFEKAELLAVVKDALGE